MRTRTTAGRMKKIISIEMDKVKAIAVLYGSDSSEWEISCRSGEYTASRIDETRYDVYEIFARFGKWNLVAMRKAGTMRTTFPEGARPEVDKTDFSVMVLAEKVTFDFVYIMQHGAPGETGLLQGYFEMLGIPFSTCSAFVTTVAFDKYACKSYLRDADFVKLAPDAFVRKGDDVEAFSKKAVERLGLPLFVKPTDGGSSFGITKVSKAEDLPTAIRYAFSEGSTVIVEKGIAPEHELTCAVYTDAAGVKALPRSFRRPAGSTMTRSTTASAARSAPPRFRTSSPRRCRTSPVASTATSAAKALCEWTISPRQTASTSSKSTLSRV